VKPLNKGITMVDEPDNTSSNPQADAHLPVSGEFDANKIDTSDALTDPSEDTA
jgi:hypothetical protein